MRNLFLGSVLLLAFLQWPRFGIDTNSSTPGGIGVLPNSDCQSLRYSSATKTFSCNKVTLQSDVVGSSVKDEYANCTGLSFPVVANVTSYFRARLFYTIASKDLGTAWSINGPSFSLLGYKSAYGTLSSETVTYSSAYNDPSTANPASPGGPTGSLAILEGFITPSANGNVVVRFSSELNNSPATCKAGSFIEWF